MILVTGSSGFIGRQVLKQFSNCVRPVFRRGNIINHNNSFVVDTINGYTDWNNAFDGVKAVIHLAGLAHSNTFSLDEYQSVHIDGTLHLAREAAKLGVKRFVFVSTVRVNGNSTGLVPFNSQSQVAPTTDFAKTKHTAERKLFLLSKETGLEIVVVRPTMVYGYNAPANFSLLVKLVSALPVLPFGLANNLIDVISVNNLADLLVKCAEHPNAAGHTFLASDGETVSIKEFTNAIAKGLGKKVFQLPIPVGLMRLVGKVAGKSATMEQLFGNLEVDSSNTREILGWTPPFTMEQSMASLRKADK